MFEYILLALLFVASVFLIVAVTVQKSSDDGLSGTIAGGSSDTYYGRDKSKHSGKLLNKWTLIIAAVFVAVVLVVYVMQPDYMKDLSDPQSWKSVIEFTGWSIFD